MFSITREEFIEAALAETERLRALAKHSNHPDQISRWMTRIANIQFAIEHLDGAEGDEEAATLPPSEMRALMEILYG